VLATASATARVIRPGSQRLDGHEVPATGRISG